jgi:hypothetical protein
MSNLPSIPKRAIVSIQPNHMSPFEFLNVNSAKEMLNSRHVGGVRKTRKHGGLLELSNSCGPGLCGGKKLGRKSRRFGRKRTVKNTYK